MNKIILFLLLVLVIMSPIHAVSVLHDICEEQDELNVVIGSKLYITSSDVIYLGDPKDGVKLITTAQYKVLFGRFLDEYLTVIKPLMETEFLISSKKCQVKVKITDAERQRTELQFQEKLKSSLEESSRLGEELLVLQEDYNALQKDLKQTKFERNQYEVLAQQLNATIEANLIRYRDKFIILDNPIAYKYFFSQYNRNVGISAIMMSYWPWFSLTFIAGGAILLIYKQLRLRGE